MGIIEVLNDHAHKTSDFILRRLASRQGFGARSFYAEPFALALLHRTGKLTPGAKEQLCRSYETLDKKNPFFHWEFTHYAFLHYRLESGDLDVSKYLSPLKFRNLSITNWILLKSASKILEGSAGVQALHEAKDILERRQASTGFIQDDPAVRSFQYHCFSMALLAEIADLTKDPFFEDRFRKALDFILPFILQNGDTLYIGRGQRQIFGYGALLYALAAGYVRTKEDRLLGNMEAILAHLSSYRGPEGVLPLALNHLQPGIPETTDTRDPNYPGWYSYNNYFDYLSFFGFFSAGAAALLEGMELPPSAVPKPLSYRDDWVLKISKPKYEAVLAKCGGYWGNDMPMPYLAAGGRSLMPCYGGEQFRKSIYRLSGIPIPFLKPDFSFRLFSRCVLEGNRMIFKAPWGRVERNFDFQADEVGVRTAIRSVLPFRHGYLFLDSFRQLEERILRGPGLTVLSDAPLRYEGVRYSALGPLGLYTAGGRKHSLTLRIGE